MQCACTSTNNIKIPLERSSKKRRNHFKKNICSVFKHLLKKKSIVELYIVLETSILCRIEGTVSRLWRQTDVNCSQLRQSDGFIERQTATCGFTHTHMHLYMYIRITPDKARMLSNNYFYGNLDLSSPWTTTARTKQQIFSYRCGPHPHYKVAHLLVYIQ